MCPQCSIIFPVSVIYHVYCSAKCKRRADYLRQKAKGNRGGLQKEVILACTVCDKSFTIALRPGANPIYCSQTCRAERKREYRRKHNEMLKAKLRARYHSWKDAGLCIRCGGDRDGWQLTCSTCRPKHREQGRAAQIKRDYKLTINDVKAMEIAQDGRCAICKGPPTGQYGKLVIDHDHNSGTVRSLLCSNCNTGIGLLGDNIERLQAAAHYIQSHSSERA